MLHKAAAHLQWKLHHLHQIRSAFNNTLGSSTSAAGSSSSSAGAGGAKWHAGRSSSYQAYGKLQPSANPGSSSDVASRSDDDSEEKRAIYRRHLFKSRTRSLSLSGKRPIIPSVSIQAQLLSKNITTAAPKLVRRNSTSVVAEDAPPTVDPAILLEKIKRQQHVDPRTPVDETEGHLQAYRRRLYREASAMNDDAVRALVENYLASGKLTFVAHLDALEALSRTYKAPDSVELHEGLMEHLEQCISPVMRAMSYSFMLKIYIARFTHYETQRADFKATVPTDALCKSAQVWKEGERLSKDDANETLKPHSKLVANSQAWNGYLAAKKLVQHKIYHQHYESRVPVYIMDRMLQAAGRFRDLPLATKLLATLEAKAAGPVTAALPIAPSLASYASLAAAYYNSHDFKAVEFIFQAFTAAIASVDAKTLLDESVTTAVLSELGSEEVKGERSQAIESIYNTTISARIARVQATAGLELLEQMLEKSAEDRRIPTPSPNTYLAVIKGFVEAKDYKSAAIWLHRASAAPSHLTPSQTDLFMTLIDSNRKPKEIEWCFFGNDLVSESTELLKQLGIFILSQNSPSSPSSPEPSSPVPTSQSAESETVISEQSISTPPTSVADTSAGLPKNEHGIPIQPSYIQALPSLPYTVNKFDIPYSGRLNYFIRQQSANALQDAVQSADKGVFAHPTEYSKLCEVLGRLGKAEESMTAYQLAYAAIANISELNERMKMWDYLEDCALIGQAHLGNLDNVAAHRQRLIDVGSAPSADGYAAMINCAHDTTDDATVAVSLFEEARRFNVTPNIFLYNSVIAKLSKAKRTQAAMQYFQEIKKHNIAPTAVTYGSLISVCCKTGYENFAVEMFEEMVRLPKYKARVPPYNTMIQYFVFTNPDRKKALSYFDRLLQAGVKPSEYTYKLLLQAYGQIEPIDTASMHDVFKHLVKAHGPSGVTDNHWATLITTYGCTLKDIGKAVEVFDGIASFNQTGTIGPLVYEALFESFVAVGQPEKVEEYYQKMVSSGVPSTSYVHNSRIRAALATENLEHARSMFSEMHDLPSGVRTTTTQGTICTEPSTFEIMITAERKAGNSEQVQILLDRAIKRAFPEAVLAHLKEIAGA